MVCAVLALVCINLCSLLQGEPNVDYIHPGVGPVLNDEGEDEDKIYHAYYQWVPHMLFFQVSSWQAVTDH